MLNSSCEKVNEKISDWADEFTMDALANFFFNL